MENDDQGPKEADDVGGHFIQTPIACESGRALARVPLDSRHQGWLELPHGGVLMSMVLELAHRGLLPPLLGQENYPIRTSFRLGGPSLLLSDEIEVGVERQEREIRGWIRKQDERSPTLTARIQSGIADEPAWMAEVDRIATTVEKAGREMKDRGIPLPYTRNCFVCGSERKQPGLERRFYCVETAGLQVAFTFMGLDPEDQEKLSVYRLPEGQIHPGILAAILDETLGWAGFIHTRQGGVTVRLESTLFRSIEPGEKMLCFGACTGTRGKSPAHLFWHATGGILPIGEEDFSPVMLASGQWLAMPKLTEEMKTHLTPADWTRRWFDSENP